MCQCKHSEYPSLNNETNTFRFRLEQNVDIGDRKTEGRFPPQTRNPFLPLHPPKKYYLRVLCVTNMGSSRVVLLVGYNNTYQTNEVTCHNLCSQRNKSNFLLVTYGPGSVCSCGTRKARQLLKSLQNHNLQRVTLY